VVIEDIVPRCGGSPLGTFGVPYIDGKCMEPAVLVHCFGTLMHKHMCAVTECTDLKPGQAAIFDVVINTQYRNCINKRSYGSYIACDTKFVSLLAVCTKLVTELWPKFEHRGTTLSISYYIWTMLSAAAAIKGSVYAPGKEAMMAREYRGVRALLRCVYMMASMLLLTPCRCDGDPGGMAITVDGVSMGHGDVDLGPVPLGRSRIVVSIVNGLVVLNKYVGCRCRCRVDGHIQCMYNECCPPWFLSLTGRFVACTRTLS
jgi:hypothetical protein